MRPLQLAQMPRIPSRYDGVRRRLKVQPTLHSRIESRRPWWCFGTMEPADCLRVYSAIAGTGALIALASVL